MKKFRKKFKKVNKPAKFIYLFFMIVYLVFYGLFIKSLLQLSSIETLLRIIIIIFFGLWFLIYGFVNLLKLLQKKYKTFIITTIVSLMFIGIFFVSSFFIDSVYNAIMKITENKSSLYVSNLVKLKDTKFNEKSVIGKISNELDVEGYILAGKLIDKEKINNKIKSYDDYTSMIMDLYNRKIDAVFVTGDYIDRFKSIEGFENISSDLSVIKSYSEKRENENLVTSSNKDFSESLTFLIMGVDSEKKGLNPNAAFNGDTLMLATFNPKTLDVLLLSIPRDTYVPIVCNNNKYAKINSAAAYGTNCVINTVNKLLDINIDYYVKINFKGVVDLVDAVGGVYVDVEKPDFKSFAGQNFGGKMCEQNSDRQFGSKLVCVDPGWQELNGEQALAYARNRHLYAAGDLDRIVHQQQIVEAMAKKLISLDSVVNFQHILSAISDNMTTNMSTDKILSGYEVGKNMAKKALSGDDFININKAFLETYELRVYLPSGMYTSAQAYYKDSLADVKDQIKIILDQKENKDIKTFSFSVNELYEFKNAGKGLRKEPSLSLIPNFIGSSVDKVKEFCTKNNIDLKIEYVNSDEEYFNSEVEAGLIADQSVHIGTLLNNVKEMTIYINNAE